jgi:hypothetical protein
MHRPSGSDRFSRVLKRAAQSRALVSTILAAGALAASGAVAAGATRTTATGSLSRTEAHGRLAALSSTSAIRIVGGSAAQRALLREIVGTLGSTHIRVLRVARVRGGVNLDAPVHSEQATWELTVVGVAFHDLSIERRLPHVLAVDAPEVGWPTSNEGPMPPRATRASVVATRRIMRTIALASGARITQLTVSAPDGLAVLLRLRVDDAARFLERRLRTLADHAAAHERRWEGLLIEVDDARGLAWAEGESRVGGEGYVRLSLSGCNPFPPPGMLSPPPPCPSP